MTPDQWDRLHRIAESLGWEAACAKAFMFGKRDANYEAAEFLRAPKGCGMSLTEAADVIEIGVYPVSTLEARGE